MGETSRVDGYCKTEVGYEVGRFYGWVYDGIFQNQAEIDNNTNAAGKHVNQQGAQPGDVRYVDVDGDGEITSGDQTIIGSGMPKVQYGLSFRLEYKGFDLYVSTFGAAGHKVLDEVDRILRTSYGVTNKSTDLLNAWTPDNTNTNVPAVYYKANGSVTNDYFSERFLQNGAYWKIANIELGYNFNDKLFGGYLNNVRLYLSAQNVATVSKYRGYNLDFAGGTFTPGFNYCSYPAPMTFMIGAKLSF